MPIQQWNSVQTQLCCRISFSIKKTKQNYQHKKSYFSLCNKTYWLYVFAFHLFFQNFGVCAFYFPSSDIMYTQQFITDKVVYCIKFFCYVFHWTLVICFLCIPICSHPTSKDLHFLHNHLSSKPTPYSHHSISDLFTYLHPTIWKKVFSDQYSGASVRSCKVLLDLANTHLHRVLHLFLSLHSLDKD